MKLDLHCHTTYSDGTKSVFEVFSMAKNLGLTHLAITDHDTVNGLDDAVKAANDCGINVILGVELSTVLNGESVHILGYFKNLDDAHILRDYFNDCKKRREQRALKIVELLKLHFNIEINIDDLINSNKNITRGNLAKKIMEKYHITNDEIFDKYLSDSSKAYIPSTELDTFSGIEMLKKANAIVVLAHPVLLKKNNYLDIASKVDGIEAIYPMNKKEDEIKFINYARENNLFYTAGSDYHGIDNDNKHPMLATSTLEGQAAVDFLNKLQ